MPARKWIHRSKNSHPDSVNSAIEPSLERTVGQALPSRVVVEVVILLFVVVELVLVVELLVVIEVFVVLVEVLVLVVVLVLLGFRVVLGVQGILLVFDPWPIAEPRHEKLLRAVPALTCETGVVTVGRRSAGL